MTRRIDNLLRRQLGNYRLVRLIGEGGFAVVYLGEHIHLGTQAAIKVLSVQLAGEDVERFRAEARILARLEQPHIVRVLDFGIENDIPFLVMAYAPNGSLRQRHPEKSVLPLSTIIIYVNQIASALHYVHDQKVIHRDVKPQNMLLSANNEVLLSDFGIAVVAQTNSNQGTQDLAGTISYMAPEQLRGKPVFASDQYSLGCMVYEWLCGERPFYGNFVEMVHMHEHVPPSPLREKIPSLSPSVEIVVLTALAKEPALRFASVQAFANALQQGSLLEPSMSQVLALAPSSPLPSSLSEKDAQILASPPDPAATLAPGASSPVTGGLRRPSRRTILAGLIGGVVGIGAGSAISWLALPHTVVVPAPNQPMSDTLTLYRGHQASVNTAVWSPDGQHIASGSAFDNTVHVWDATSDKDNARYRIQSASVNAVAWSPDGQHIASASGSFFGNGDDHTVQIWDVARRSSIITYRGHTKEIREVAWSLDSKYIASAGDDTTVQVWDATTGRNVLTYTGHTQPVYAVMWSPDGKHIASAGKDKIVRVWMATTGQPVITYQHSDYLRAVAWSPDGQRIASSGGFYDATVQVWDAVTGKQLLVYRGHSQGVNTVAWSLDGQRIASGSSDKTVQIWVSAHGKQVFTYGEHTLGINEVAWSPKQPLIASASADATVRIWKIG